MSQIPSQHFDAPRRVPAAAIDGGTDEYYLSTALSPYPSDQYTPPSPHRQYVGGYGDETALSYDYLWPSNYAVIRARDAWAHTDPFDPPPPALSPYPSDQYSPPLIHRQYVGGDGDETALYYDYLPPSNYPSIRARDAWAPTDPFDPPPPRYTDLRAAVTTEMAIGVARIIPALVQFGIAKAKMRLIEMMRPEISEMEDNGETTNDVDSLPQVEEG